MSKRKEETLKQLYNELKDARFTGIRSEAGKKIVLELNQAGCNRLHDVERYIMENGINSGACGEKKQRRILARIQELNDYVYLKLGKENVNQIESYARVNGYDGAEEYLEEHALRVVRNAFVEQS